MSATTTLDPVAETRPTETTAARQHAVVPTELGDLTLVADAGALVGVYFPEHRPAPPASAFGELVDVDADPVLTESAAQLVDYAAGRRTGFDLPLRAEGSERARRVWELIASVPRGETTTYAALGRAVGIGPRAAGQFVARNPLSMAVPCHRVVASDGRLTGYAGGVDRKRRLLELEGALPVGAGVVAAATPAGEAGEAGEATAAADVVEAVGG